LNRDGIFKYRADARPFALVTLAFALSLAPFFFDLPWPAEVAYAIGLLAVRRYAPYAQHNHGHLPTFNSRALNAVYDFLLAQTTGYPTSQWELHHNRGHHRNYLTPELDVARIVDLKTGRPMARWWYAVRGFFTIARDCWRIGLTERRKGQKSLLPKWTIETVVQIAFTVALVYLSAWKATLFFIIPNVLSALFIWWESYPHHHETPGTHVYDGSVTTLSPFFNRQAFNIGHHTAHHERPTMHWSLLPQRTEQILSQIPAHCVADGYGKRRAKEASHAAAPPPHGSRRHAEALRPPGREREQAAN
jgi:fatty acid desaturase